MGGNEEGEEGGCIERGIESWIGKDRDRVRGRYRSRVKGRIE
jgi:hypothetical protein